MIVVDSSILIAYFRDAGGEAGARFRAIDPDEVLIGDLVLLEVLAGTRDDLHAARLERELRSFEMAAMLNPALAVRAARHYRLMRSAGVTIRKSADLIIGAFCVEHGHALLHQDRDFMPMAKMFGLRFA